VSEFGDRKDLWKKEDGLQVVDSAFRLQAWKRGFLQTEWLSLDIWSFLSL